MGETSKHDQDEPIMEGNVEHDAKGLVKKRRGIFQRISEQQQ